MGRSILLHICRHCIPLTINHSQRTGIRGLLSNLIWGTPTKAEADEGEEEGGQSDDDQDQAAGKTPDDAHVISDDDDDEEEGTTQGVLDAQRKQTAYTSSQKGKGKEVGDGCGYRRSTCWRIARC